MGCTPEEKSLSRCAVEAPEVFLTERSTSIAYRSALVKAPRRYRSRQPYQEILSLAFPHHEQLSPDRALDGDSRRRIRNARVVDVHASRLHQPTPLAARRPELDALPEVE